MQFYSVRDQLHLLLGGVEAQPNVQDLTGLLVQVAEEEEEPARVRRIHLLHQDEKPHEHLLELAAVNHEQVRTFKVVLEGDLNVVDRPELLEHV